MDALPLTRWATEQGLDPIVAALHDAGIEAGAQHMGGNVMSVLVYMPPDRVAYFAIQDGEETGTWAMSHYASDDVDGADVGYTLTTMDVIAHVRGKIEEKQA